MVCLISATSTACSNKSDASSSSYTSGYSHEEEESANEPFDEDVAREKAEEDLADEPYDGSYGCTEDCAGHEEGWRWRAGHGYLPSSDSQSFDEGAQAFEDSVDDRVEEMRQRQEE